MEGGEKVGVGINGDARAKGELEPSGQDFGINLGDENEALDAMQA